jgi:hypothetical protein
MLESTILSVLPLYSLSNSDPEFGTMDTFFEAGATCFTAIIVIVNFKVHIIVLQCIILLILMSFSPPQMFFIQTRWYWGNYLVIFLSIAFYFVTLFFITAFVDLDFNFYHVSVICELHDARNDTFYWCFLV